MINSPYAAKTLPNVPAEAINKACRPNVVRLFTIDSLAPTEIPSRNKKKKNRIRNRLTDLLQQFYLRKEIPDGNAAEHDSDYCKHPL